MEFSIKPLELTCFRPRSTKDSPWGETDGLRLYVFVQIGLGTPYFMKSLGPFPSPDEGYIPMRQGEIVNLASLPPEGRPSWQSDSLLFDEGSAITFTAIGINVGQGYIGGGGGRHNGKTHFALEAFEKLAEVIAQKKEVDVKGSIGAQSTRDISPFSIKPTSAAAVGIGVFVMGALVEAAKGLADTTDCRGTVFIFQRHVSGSDLLASLLQSRGRLYFNFPQEESLPINPVGSDCNSPAYGLKIQTRLETPITVDVRVEKQFAGMGPSEPLVPQVAVCASIAAEAKVWSIQYDHSIRLVPSFRFVLLRFSWFISGQRLNGTSGTISVAMDTVKQPNNRVENSTVEIAYTIGANHELTLTTRSVDGNFQLNVSGQVEYGALSKSVTVFQDTLQVDGHEERGDEAWIAYNNCIQKWLADLGRVFIPQLVLKKPSSDRFDPRSTIVTRADLESVINALIQTVRRLDDA